MGDRVAPTGDDRPRPSEWHRCARVGAALGQSPHRRPVATAWQWARG